MSKHLYTALFYQQNAIENNGIISVHSVLHAHIVIPFKFVPILELN